LLDRPSLRDTGEIAAEIAAVGANKALRVLIAENHRDLSDSLAQIIDEEPDMCCVGQVAAASAVLPTAEQAGANALILDLGLQGGSGMGLLEELTLRMPHLRIVMFSGCVDDALVRESLQRGAAAFIAKGCDPCLLLDALRQGVVTG
jgi:two-component system, NarL family, response regulator DevR